VGFVQAWIAVFFLPEVATTRTAEFSIPLSLVQAALRVLFILSFCFPPPFPPRPYGLRGCDGNFFLCVVESLKTPFSLCGGYSLFSHEDSSLFSPVFFCESSSLLRQLGMSLLHLSLSGGLDFVKP